MAAPRVWKFVHIPGFCWSFLRQTESRLGGSTLQVRYKQQHARNFKAPHVAKQREAWKKTAKKFQIQVKDTRGTDNPAWQSRRPRDNVWLRAHYPAVQLTLEEALSRHREHADPAMFDNMQGLVYADMELDMSTLKKTKFLSPVKMTLKLPHDVGENPEMRCIVFTSTAEGRQKALDLGAKFAGGAELVKQLQEGVIDKSDIDHILCTPDMLPSLVPIRSLLREGFPNKPKGSLSSNIEEMLDLFMTGITVTSVKETDVMARIQASLGKLDMPTEQIVDNFRVYVDKISQHRPENLGPFIKKICIISPPSPEIFQVRLADYVPGYEEEGADMEKDATDEESSDEEEDRASEAKS